MLAEGLSDRHGQVGEGRPCSRSPGAFSPFSGIDGFAPLAEIAGGGTIYAQEDTAAFVYEVVEGMVRTVVVSDDGRRIVRGFFSPGEVFGLTRNGKHDCAAEAVCETTVSRCARERLESVALVDAGVAKALWTLMLLDGERSATRLALLAHATAVKRIAHFLTEMSERLGYAGRLRLPMSRYDIGDYLGLSSETVSRAFTVLRDRGLIATDGRAVVLLRPELVSAMAH